MARCCACGRGGNWGMPTTTRPPPTALILTMGSLILADVVAFLLLWTRATDAGVDVSVGAERTETFIATALGFGDGCTTHCELGCPDKK